MQLLAKGKELLGAEQAGKQLNMSTRLSTSKELSTSKDLSKSKDFRMSKDLSMSKELNRDKEGGWEFQQTQGEQPTSKEAWLEWMGSGQGMLSKEPLRQQQQHPEQLLRGSSAL